MTDYRSVLHLPDERFFLYSIGYEDQPSMAHWGPGRRHYCILHYIIRGEGWFGGRKLRAGQGFYIHADQMHEYHADAQNGWHYFWMILSVDLANQYVLPYLTMDQDGVFEADFTGRLLLERPRYFASHQPLEHMEALSIFFSVMALHASHHKISPNLPLSHLNNAKVLIENRFGRRLTVRDVAREIGVDDRYLYNLFIRYEGISPKECISRCITSHACRMLMDTSLSITEIAEALGFDDVCTFSKFFRKRTGKPPTHYRESER